MGNKNRMPKRRNPRKSIPRNEPPQQPQPPQQVVPLILKVGVILLAVICVALLGITFYANSAYEENLVKLQEENAQLEESLSDKEKQIEELEDEIIVKDNQIKQLEDESANLSEQSDQSDQPVIENSELENTLYLDLKYGRVVIKMRPDLAPNHVERIKTLARQGFYDGIKFHRVIDGFMAQAGDPTGTGTSGSDLPDLKAEFSDTKHVRGTVSMARKGGDNDSANSQFFIVFETSSFLDGQYTVWGEVTDGMEFVDAIVRGEPPKNPDTIVKMQVAADEQ